MYWLPWELNENGGNWPKYIGTRHINIIIKSNMLNSTEKSLHRFTVLPDLLLLTQTTFLVNVNI